MLNKPNKPKPVTLRPDGRPEVYDVPEVPGHGYQCFICDRIGHIWKRYAKPGEIFMTNPANTPTGKAEFVCKAHLPPTTVIYNPVDDTCRDVTGENIWKETDDDQPGLH